MMARRVVNRRELRVSEQYLRDVEELKKAEKGKPKERRARGAGPSKPRPRKTTRLKAYWVVLNSAGKEVAEFDYHEHAQAVQKAAELNAAKKSHHFVRLSKKEIAE